MCRDGLPPHGKRRGFHVNGWVCTSHQELRQSDHAHQSLPTQSTIQLSMIFTGEFPFTTRSTTSVKIFTYHNFSCEELHSFFKRYGDFTDSDPSVCVDPLNHDATSAPTIVFGAAVLLSISISCFHTSQISLDSYLKIWCTRSPVLLSLVVTALLHHENKAFCTVPISLLGTHFHQEFPICPLRSHATVSLQQYRRTFLVWRCCVLLRTDFSGAARRHVHFYSLFFPFPVIRWMFHVVIREGNKVLLVFSSASFFFNVTSILGLRPTRSQFCSKRHPLLCHPTCASSSRLMFSACQSFHQVVLSPSASPDSFCDQVCQQGEYHFCGWMEECQWNQSKF